MPNYEYACKTCTQTVTVNRGIKELEFKPKCLKCDAYMVRVYDAPVVTFNSPGFYSTEGKI